MSFQYSELIFFLAISETIAYAYEANIVNKDSPIFPCNNRLFVVMAGIEQGNISNKEFMEEITRYECIYHRSKDLKDKNKKANRWKKIGEKFNFFGGTGGGFEDGYKADDDVALRTNRRNKFACSKISSSMSAILFAAIFPQALHVCNFDTSTD